MARSEITYYAHELDPDFDEVLILPISDVHYGSPQFSKSTYERQLRKILERPNAFVILNGDLCESSIRTSKGEIFKQVGTPQDQRDWNIEKLYPLKDRILGLTMGNHEYRVYHEVGIDIAKDIAQALDVPYRQEGLLLKISWGKGNSRHPESPFVDWGYVTHGYGGARTKSAKAVKVERVATWIHADFYIMSHDHVVNAAPDVYLMPDPRTHIDPDTGFRVGMTKSHRKMLVKSNAYLKWGGYSEMGGFPPVDMVAPIVKLKSRDEWTDGHLIRVEV